MKTKMTVFYLLKPDMLEDPAALEYYKKFISDNKLKETDGIDIRDWIELSKVLYDPICANNNDLQMRRKQMITTIKAYQLLKPEGHALALFYDVSPAMLESMSEFKKDLRRKFVYDGNRYYIRFDRELPLEKSLKDINFNEIQGEIIVTSSTEKIETESVNMAFINRIHFPDPNILEVKKDLSIIKGHVKKK